MVHRHKLQSPKILRVRTRQLDANSKIKKRNGFHTQTAQASMVTLAIQSVRPDFVNNARPGPRDNVIALPEARINMYNSGRKTVR